MKTEKRRVLLFVIVGLSAAVIVSAIIWRSGAPSSANSASSANNSREAVAPANPKSGDSDPSIAPGDSSQANRPGTAMSQRPNFAAPKTNDPFLAPGAVVGGNSNDNSANVYRPSNLVMAEPGQTNSNNEQGYTGREPSSVDSDSVSVAPTSEVPVSSAPASTFPLPSIVDPPTIVTREPMDSIIPAPSASGEGSQASTSAQPSSVSSGSSASSSAQPPGTPTTTVQSTVSSTNQ